VNWQKLAVRFEEEIQRQVEEKGEMLARWLNHLIAMQTTTTAFVGDVPFFEMATMGGDNKMRGCYHIAYRDKALLNEQVEYRNACKRLLTLSQTLKYCRAQEKPGFTGFV
jgi:hypothetical protein